MGVCWCGCCVVDVYDQYSQCTYRHIIPFPPSPPSHHIPPPPPPPPHHHHPQEASDFEQAVTAYIYRHLEKGIPALFVDLRPLYTNPTKRDTIGRIVSDIQTSLEAAQSHRSQSHTSQSPISTHNKDDAGNNTGNNTGNSGKDGSDTGRVGNDNNNNNNSSSSSSSSYSTSPQMLIWTWAFRAQHEDYLGNTGAALTLVEKAIDHTPTVIELHSIRSKVLKHAGDPQGAAAAAEQARCMDLADR